jgi:hypothetical protein
MKFTGKVLILTQIWFEDDFVFRNHQSRAARTETIKSTLLSILHEAYLLNPSFIKAEEGYITHPTELPKNGD